MNITDINAKALRELAEHNRGSEARVKAEEALPRVLTSCTKRANDGFNTFGLSDHEQKELGGAGMQALNVLMAERGFECKKERAPFTRSAIVWWER